MQEYCDATCGITEGSQVRARGASRQVPSSRDCCPAPSICPGISQPHQLVCEQFILVQVQTASYSRGALCTTTSSCTSSLVWHSSRSCSGRSRSDSSQSSLPATECVVTDHTPDEDSSWRPSQRHSDLFPLRWRSHDDSAPTRRQLGTLSDRMCHAPLSRARQSVRRAPLPRVRPSTLWLLAHGGGPERAHRTRHRTPWRRTSRSPRHPSCPLTPM